MDEFATKALRHERGKCQGRTWVGVLQENGTSNRAVASVQTIPKAFGLEAATLERGADSSPFCRAPAGLGWE